MQLVDVPNRNDQCPQETNGKSVSERGARMWRETGLEEFSELWEKFWTLWNAAPKRPGHSSRLAREKARECLISVT